MFVSVFSLFFVFVFCNDIVEKVNALGTTWVAGNNFGFDKLSPSELSALMGYKAPAKMDQSIPKGLYSGKNALPSSFDARLAWPQCTVIQEPLNQGQCGLCWAFGATKSFQDRLCIATNATTDILLSEQELVSCNIFGLEACNGGDPVTALRYIAEYGLPSAACVPYTSGQDGTVPSCASQCNDGSAMKEYYASLWSLRWHPTVEGIMESIYTQGPVEACFTVYADFMHYTSGVYSHVTGDELGGHCIVLVGWGKTSDGVDYWIASNSWGNNWGLHGFFWIKKGDDECGIERSVFSIMPASSQ